MREYDLLAPGIARRGGIWAVLGNDTGSFTLALCKLVGVEAELYVIDKKSRALEKQRRELAKGAPAARVHWVCADYAQAMDLPPLDGMVLVNALHDVKLERQEELLRHLRGYLKPDGGRLILVDREVRTASLRVKYPVNYESFEYLAGTAGFVDLRRLAVLPVGLVREMYSALGMRAG
ncbi:MAG: methyltransferase domain-containing protein [Ktedonobacterales bacterium]